MSTRSLVIYAVDENLLNKDETKSKFSFGCILPVFLLIMSSIFFPVIRFTIRILKSFFRTTAGLYQIFEWLHVGVFSTSRSLDFYSKEEANLF